MDLSFSFTKLRTCIRFAGAFALFAMSMSLSVAQGEVSVMFNPPDGWESGDPIQMIIHYGTPEAPIELISEVTFEIELPDGMLVTDASQAQLDLDRSWFQGNGYWDGEVDVRRNGKLVVVSLVRSTDDPIGGHGEIARVIEMTYEIDELSMKNAPQAQATVSRLHLMPVWVMAIDPIHSVIHVPDASEETMLELLDLQGRTIARGPAKVGISAARYPRQVMMVRLSQGNQILDQKLTIIGAQP